MLSFLDTSFRVEYTNWQLFAVTYSITTWRFCDALQYFFVICMCSVQLDFVKIHYNSTFKILKDFGRSCGRRYVYFLVGTYQMCLCTMQHIIKNNLFVLCELSAFANKDLNNKIVQKEVLVHGQVLKRSRKYWFCWHGWPGESIYSFVCLSISPMF